MVQVHYRRGLNALFALVAGFLSLSLLLSIDDWRDGIIGVLMGLMMGAGAVKFALDAMSDAPAIAWDSSGLKARGQFGGTKVVPWRLVMSIGMETQVARYLFVKVAKYDYLVIERIGGRRIKFADVVLQLPPGGMRALVEELAIVRARAMSGAPEVDWRADGPRLASEQAQVADFDPDAALARYLARKGEGVGERPTSPPPAPAIPARPVFGRRSSSGG